MKLEKLFATILFILIMMIVGALIGAGLGLIAGVMSGLYEILSFAVFGSLAGLVISILSIINDRRHGKAEVRT